MTKSLEGVLVKAPHKRQTFSDEQLDEFLKCGNNWDAEAVKYNIENSINLSIKNFKNYV